MRYRRIDRESVTDIANGSSDPPLVESLEAAVSSEASATSSNARVDTVVIYIPDVWSIMPNESDHSAQMAALKSVLDQRLAQLDAAAAPPPPPPAVEVMDTQSTNKESTTDSSAKTETVPATAKSATPGDDSTTPAAAVQVLA